MTRALPFTEANLKRAIRAAQHSGLQVVGIRPDGTLLLKGGDKSEASIAAASFDENTETPSKWCDIKA
jgi:hypothetical protein